MTFEQFLDPFVDTVKKKSKQLNQTTWILETTGSTDAAALKADLDTELRLLFNDKETFSKLQAWDCESFNPTLKRQLNVLIRTFKPNQIPKEILEKISKVESELALLYSNFRPVVDGKALSENEIKEMMKTENDVQARKKIWEASKEVGKELAAHIIKLVKLRNEAAHHLGYSDYFTMQLGLQEVDKTQLFEALDQFSKDSEEAYLQVVDEINTRASKRFNVPKEDIGPWAWSEPFCQEDPIDAKELDDLVAHTDILEASRKFYQKMGFDITEILKRSDNFERAGKNQHAMCIHIDREGDVRTLNNVKPTIKWLEVVLHEVGHAVYEEGFEKQLPWLLREPPHMIPTEAMALLMGRQAYRKAALDELVGPGNTELKEKAEQSLRRRQFIFNRWALVMTYFEKALYQDPDQDLNTLWWNIVEKEQKISSKGSSHGCDWAAKYHIGLAPVYYYSYLLGELFASEIEESLPQLMSETTKEILTEKLFKLGNALPWSQLVENFSGKPLSSHAWLKQFGSSSR